jgi:hypothetical protein
MSLNGFAVGGTEESLAEVRRVADANAKLRAVVDEQAEDEGLWFIARTAPEAYLQAALRRLHELIEGKASGGE